MSRARAGNQLEFYEGDYYARGSSSNAIVSLEISLLLYAPAAYNMYIGARPRVYALRAVRRAYTRVFKCRAFDRLSFALSLTHSRAYTHALFRAARFSSVRWTLPLLRVQWSPPSLLPSLLSRSRRYSKLPNRSLLCCAARAPTRNRDSISPPLSLPSTNSIPACSAACLRAWCALGWASYFLRKIHSREIFARRQRATPLIASHCCVACVLVQGCLRTARARIDKNIQWFFEKSSIGLRSGFLKLPNESCVRYTGWKKTLF